MDPARATTRSLSDTTDVRVSRADQPTHETRGDLSRSFHLDTTEKTA